MGSARVLQLQNLVPCLDLLFASNISQRTLTVIMVQSPAHTLLIVSETWAGRCALAAMPVVVVGTRRSRAFGEFPSRLVEWHVARGSRQPVIQRRGCGASSGFLRPSNVQHRRAKAKPVVRELYTRGSFP